MIATSDGKTGKNLASQSLSAEGAHDTVANSMPIATAPSTRQRLLRFGLISVAIGAFGLAFWIWREDLRALMAVISDQEAVSAYLQGFGVWGPFVLALSQMTQVLIAFIPGHVFLVAAGYVYGFPLGLLMNITFTVVASQICFLLARWAGRPVVNRFVNPEVTTHWEHVANEKGFLFFTISFLLPVFPSDAMNFVAGLSGISSRRFLGANFLGRLPSAIMLTLIGSHGLQMSNVAWGGIAVLMVFFFLLGRYVVRTIQESAYQQKQI